MDLKVNLLQVLKSLPEIVKLVAVSKTHPVEDILELYDAGQRVFGENRVQEFIEKYPKLPTDIEWHFIGHLQTNKVKQIVPLVHTIHSVDSFKLLKEIDKEAAKVQRCISCLFEFHIADEDSKFGLNLNSASEFLSSPEYFALKNVQIIGVMGMATFTDDHNQVRIEFRKLRSIFDSLRQAFFVSDKRFKEISMGMTLDYPIAIEEGSTMVRIGSAIFGERTSIR
ncbi:MAG: YggS family pyridoxal phosphate-dependent enzyme [Bacteroidales bacterium]|nr:YggS family pyridoxal phosphate-dependent enzyme [Bacteroidales bacterium]